MSVLFFLQLQSSLPGKTVSRAPMILAVAAVAGNIKSAAGVCRCFLQVRRSRGLGVRAGRGTACRAHFNHCPGCLSCPCQLENPQNHGRFNCLNQRACRDKSMHVLEKTARKVLWLYQGNEFTCIPPSCYTFSQ